ncbi:MAG: hypothetical protein ACLQUY_06695 [Ktedonobacterales bacterium]
MQRSGRFDRWNSSQNHGMGMRCGMFLALALIGTLGLLGILPGSLLVASTAYAGSSGTLMIIVPSPSSGSPQGPVGTNVTITATGLTASDTYDIGFADQSGCSSSFQSFGFTGVPTDTSGNFAYTFAWPGSLATVGTTYYICAQDASNSLVQSQNTFTVAGSQSPAITTQAVAGPTPGAGTPTLPTSGYYPGSYVEIQGSGFEPSGVTLVAYLSSTQVQSPSDLSNASQLPALGGQGITSSSNGQVTATVQIPSSQSTGSYYLYLVSNDSQANALPSLMANAIIAITVAPTPTATPVPPTPTPTLATTTTTTTSNNGGGPGVGRLAAIFVLGVFSLALFVVGVFLLVSATTLPRQDQSQG